MVKGFEEGQRQKVSCPTMLPFHPTTQNGARPVPPIRVVSRGSIPPETEACWSPSHSEGDVSHPTRPFGPGLHPHPHLPLDHEGAAHPHDSHATIAAHGFPTLQFLC